MMSAPPGGAFDAITSGTQPDLIGKDVQDVAMKLCAGPF
ncbi:Haloacid dehalogenase I [Pseudomonas syringae pv. solidagae]|uniref:Haloacid dehalogenase I n=2 Tax=Pseudomonas syringae TaxID=317 RepID=A0A0N8SV01_PSESX|nr:Haloacid dehalogenase I [Pseudomonas syringae pv. aceris]KPY61816.1 Haloacid dehalogenase I [Pseudomonas syringae pv. solidagae]RMT39292.1 Haloacid dehalogenase I [Pseudomonas syringae pv. solidagae]RMT39737.1 Haloacid dehalogenase I [Pseudomonas syringae pv. solidagae]